MKIPENIDIPRSEWETLIAEWVSSEEHRKMLKRNLLDGRTYEQLAEEFDCSRDKIARVVPKLEKRIFKKI